MKNLNPFLIKNWPNNRPSLWLIIIFLASALVGFADAAFLTAKHYLGGPIPCAILKGCETVITSQYSEIFGVSTALFGAVYYLIVAILVLAYLDSRNYKLLGMAARLTIIGLLASIWFVALQVFVINALCLYCLISAGTSTVLFVSGLFIIKSEKY